MPQPQKGETVMTAPTYLIDIEANGLESFELEEVHCICCKQLGSDVTVRYVSDTSVADGLPLEKFYELFQDKEAQFVAHNGLSYDFIVLARKTGISIEDLYRAVADGRMIDTLIWSRFLYPNMAEIDSQTHKVPGGMCGSHSLGAWGHRLGNHKGEYTGGWETLTQEMVDYCVQDIEVLESIVNKLKDNPRLLPDCMLDEHKFAFLMRLQERNGFCIDREALDSLILKLQKDMVELKDKLVNMFPPDRKEMKIPEYWEAGGTKYSTKKAAVADGHRPKDVVRGPNEIRITPFEPTRLKFANKYMERYGMECDWPVQTDGGSPKVDEKVLRMLGTEEALTMAEYLECSKNLSQVATGDGAWINWIQEDGRIYGRVNSLRARTTRCGHMQPNVAQVPSAPEYRKVWTSREGWSLVGADASGLEARWLAHYLAPIDGGEFRDIVLDGDIHQINADIWKVTRSKAKAPLYAMLYGVGDEKLGLLLEPPGADKKSKIKRGKQTKKLFFQRFPAYNTLLERVQAAVKKRGRVRGIDGRLLYEPNQHSALNTLLQSAGSVLMKKSLTIWWEHVMELGYKNEVDFALCANVHDEVQFECKPELAEELGKLFVQSITEAGEYLGSRIPMTGEYMIGKNWSETH